MSNKKRVNMSIVKPQKEGNLAPHEEGHDVSVRIPDELTKGNERVSADRE